MKIIELSDEQLKNIETVLNYLLDSEITSYQEHYSTLIDEENNVYDFLLNKEFYNNPEINHIFAITQRVKDALKI